MAEQSEDNLKRKSYEIIKNKILTCEFMPGMVIRQEALMEEIGVSRTPVREALNALAQEELILILPRRGFFVSNISVKDVSQIYTVRETVEPTIARLATPLADEKALRTLRLVFENEIENTMELVKNDYKLHTYIAEATGNKYFIRLMDNIMSHNMRVAVLGARIPKRMPKSNLEHVELIDMMLKRDAEDAEKAMKAHIRNAKTVAGTVANFNL